ncbi:MAG: peptidylprolyl isomerase [Pseudohongiellaceae bacterium]
MTATTTESANTDSAKLVLTANQNKVVGFHYRMSEVDSKGQQGEWLEDSFDGEPLYYLHGFKNIISGVETALEGKSVGEKLAATLDPLSAYGPRKEQSVQRVPVKHLQFPKPTKKIQPGMVATVKTDKGRRNVVIVKAGKFNADVDFNHPLAGKTLHYELEITSIREASPEEIAHRHVHGPGGHDHG